MKRLILFATFALASCGLPQLTATAPAPASTGIAVQADRVILSGQRAFAAAELGYITAAKGVGLLADHGVITGSLATTVRGYNADARELLIAGKATSDLADKARIASKLFAITDRLDAITEGR